MELYQAAAQFNNEGVQLLTEGKYQQSVDKLSRSIQIMKTELRSVVGRKGHFAHQKALETGELVQPTVPLRSLFSPSSAVSSSSTPSSFLYDRPLVMPDAQQASVTEFNAHVYSASVIFNLSLALHTRGDKTSLNKAEKLYLAILGLLDRSVHVLSQTQLLLHLATLNNLKQLWYDRCDFEKECVYRLTEQVDFVVDTVSQRCDAEDLLSTPAVQDLLLNLALSQPPTLAAAA